MEIVRANSQDVDQIAPLFDLYRQFYDCESDLVRAQEFIADRIERHESVIFLARDDCQQGLGFVQLYPSFCSVDTVKILILYDLYVASSARGTGLGEQLMRRAQQYANEQGCRRIDLLTAKDNSVGQRLYEKLGFSRTNENFYSYSLEL